MHDIFFSFISSSEVVSCMIRYNEKQIPEIQETAIYNSLLRLEKAANNTSSWELYGGDYDGPLFNLTTFEVCFRIS